MKRDFEKIKDQVFDLAVIGFRAGAKVNARDLGIERISSPLPVASRCDEGQHSSQRCAFVQHGAHNRDNPGGIGIQR